MYFDFEENSGGFLSKIGYKEQKIFEETETIKNVGKDVGKDVAKDVAKEILSIIENQTNITIPQIAGVLGVTERTIERYISEFKKQNKIKRIGGRKNGYRQIIED